MNRSEFSDYSIMWHTVLPSVGIAALSAREAEGGTNILAAEKVWIFNMYTFC